MITLASIAALVAALGGFITLLAKFRNWAPVTWTLNRLIFQPLDEMLGRRISEALCEQVTPLANQVDSIYHEMHPNSGTALRDVVDRTEKKVDTVMVEQHNQGDRLSKVEGQVDVLVRQG